MFKSAALAVVLAMAVTQLATFVTTVFLHRSLAHRAVRLSPVVTAVCRTVTWVTTGIRPRQWVAVHRKHHAHTDVEGDPHSPRLLGFLKVQFGNVGLYRRAAADRLTVARYARDLAADRWDKVLFDHALLGLGLGISVLCLVLGLRLGLIAAGVHAVVYLLLSAAVNAVGHVYGRRPNANTAGNSQWLAWLTAGEGLHNNHHAAPTSARLSLGRGEVDPGWWMILGLRRLHWATVRHDPPVRRVREPVA
jgi:stearoyl-CoA desaturase (Delta-9 desaturase)